MTDLKIVRKEDAINSISSELIPEDFIEDALYKSYDFRFNTVLDRVEFKEKSDSVYMKLDNYHERSILRRLKKQNISCKKSALLDIVYSDFSSKYDPFKNYFESLPPWNKKTDYIKQLADTVQVSDQQYWEKIFKKWMVGLVACATGQNYNDGILVLLGNQGIGKTRWIHKLLPEELKSYFYSGTLDNRNKDVAIHLSECFLYCLDELEDLTASRMGAFKSNSSESAIRLRRPYGRNAENLIRRASLVATVNVPRFLKDPTGSRRFLTVYAKQINYSHKIDIDKVFSQAYNAYQQGFQYWFSKKDIEEIELHNEQFIDRSDLQELILVYLDKADHTNATHFMSSSAIAKYIAEQAQKNIKTINIITLGKELNKLGFLTTKKNGIKLYMFKERTVDE